MTHEIFQYSGKVTPQLRSEALEAYRTYKGDKEQLVSLLKDNESYYRSAYTKTVPTLRAAMNCNTPFIFSARENATADASENFPSPNIIERSPGGSKAAEALSKIIPVQLDMVRFKKTFKANTRNKLKYGTAIYGVFYNDNAKSVDIRAIDILDIFVDMHLSDIQDSKFLFISAAVSNDVLKEQYPHLKELFEGECNIETLTESYTLKNRSEVLDCYYKKPDGKLHMMKLCNNCILEATEDMDGYENGLYSHGLYPVVFDTLYPVEHCPFGFGMIDIGKSTQVTIDKLDGAITKNIMINANPRYLCKKNGGIDEEAFSDISRSIVRYEGDVDSVRPIDAIQINQFFISHRETKKDELKELLANRDFQQGSTSGGVTAASAIQSLQQAGEKRSRSMVDDTYAAYRDIIVMVIELIRQFYNDKRTFRIEDEAGQKTFLEFSSDQMYESQYSPDFVNGSYAPIEFDIDIVPQRENPYTQETMNNTLLTLYQSGLLSPQNYETSVMVLKNMSFDGKNKLISDFRELYEQLTNPAPPVGDCGVARQCQSTTETHSVSHHIVPQSSPHEIIPTDINAQNLMQQSQTQSIPQETEQLPLEITGGNHNVH